VRKLAVPSVPHKREFFMRIAPRVIAALSAAISVATVAGQLKAW